MRLSAEPNFQLSEAERLQLEKAKGVVFDLQRYSLHDGPGLRTNVFLKGCPLRCPWCANPESQKSQPELALSASRCLACGQFGEACSTCWARDQERLDKDGLKEKYGPRVALCPTGALRWLGVRQTAGEIIGAVLRDVPFYGEEGGLTLTGGEPATQPDLAEALLRLAKAVRISTAMETCGHAAWAVWERLWPYLDHILFDVKSMDDETHRRFTGVSNTLILSNLGRLVSLGAPVTIRIPLIPGFNASEASLRAIVEFAQTLGGSIQGIDLLPYHTWGKAKYKALGRDYPWPYPNRLPETEVKALAQVVEGYGFKVTVGG
jgi:pyruvate formate lyase activating enzyme